MRKVARVLCTAVLLMTLAPSHEQLTPPLPPILTAGPTLTTTTTHSVGDFDPSCQDKMENCELFGSESCSGQYEDWARDQCALTCRYCVGPPTTPPPCVDLLENCASYPDSSCTDPMYVSWAKANCRRRCRLCPQEVLQLLDSQTTTVPPERCVDKVDCRLYTQSACSGSYEPWARENCPNFCGFCIGLPTTPLPCVDAIPDCAQYQDGTCTDSSFALWVEQNCRKYCGLCSGGPSITSRPTVMTSPPILTPPPIHTPPPLATLAPPPPPGKK